LAQAQKTLLIECFECGELTKLKEAATLKKSIEFLPKNLALLSLEDFASPAPPQMSCQWHFKKVEAYCFDDKALLCIDCILRDENVSHKGHNMLSLDQAVQQEQASLMIQQDLISQEMAPSLMKDYERVTSLQTQLSDSHEQDQLALKNYFRQLHAALEERERQLGEEQAKSFKERMEQIEEYTEIVRKCLEHAE